MWAINSYRSVLLLNISASIIEIFDQLAGLSSSFCDQKALLIREVTNVSDRGLPFAERYL